MRGPQILIQHQSERKMPPPRRKGEKLPMAPVLIQQGKKRKGKKYVASKSVALFLLRITESCSDVLLAMPHA